MSPRTIYAALGLAVFTVPAAGYLRARSAPRSTDPRICDRRFRILEGELGRHLFAPTWLPEGMEPVEGNTTEGARRILCDYRNEATQCTLVVAQEPRGAERDLYHQQQLLPRHDLKANVNGDTAYFIRGQTGERRLVWHNNRAWMILSSYDMTDAELLRVAQSTR